MSSQTQLGGGAFQGESRPIRSSKRRRTMPTAPAMDLREFFNAQSARPTISANVREPRDGRMGRPVPLAIEISQGTPAPPPLRLNIQPRVKQQTLEWGVRELSKYKKFIRHVTYRINEGEYASEVRRCTAHAFDNLPQAFKVACKAQIGYDFMHIPSIDKRKRPQVNTKIMIQKSGVAEYSMDLAEGGIYWGHHMTGLENAEDEQKTTLVKSLDDLKNVARKHLINRNGLSERYESMDHAAAQDPSYNGTNAYRRPHHLHFVFYKLRYNIREAIGAGREWQFNKRLHNTEAPIGDCVLQCIKDQYRSGMSRMDLSLKQMRDLIDIAKKPISLDNLSLIEERLVWTTSDRKDAHKNRTHIVVFDHNFNLRRLPPFVECDKHYKTFSYMVMFGGHAHSFQCEKFANQRKKQSLSYFQAATEEGTGRASTYEESWELFTDTQHLQPSSDCIKQYINDKYKRDVCSKLKYVRNKGDGYDYYLWIPSWKYKDTQKFPKDIRAEGLHLKCKENKIQESNPDALKIPNVVKWPTVKFHMYDVLSMDIETCSSLEKQGSFEPYSIGWMFRSRYKALVAQTAEQLKEHSLIHEAIQEWLAIADSLGTTKVKVAGQTVEQPRKLYVYAHNMSKFDGLFVIRSILQHNDNITDELVSNGRYVSFTYKNLGFRDTLLIVLTSLKDAANSYGLEASKGYLPHMFLQGVPTREECIKRIHTPIKREALAPYMDWFAECERDELYSRVSGRTYDEWRKTTTVYKDWFEHKDEMCNFKEEMLAYMRKDVECLHQLIEKLGYKNAIQYGADIKVRCTQGSLATHIWKYTLFKPIPKLRTEAQHKLWLHVNRGGFSGPLSHFRKTAREGESIYKTDLNSCYPSSMRECIYTTSTGIKRPLEGFYNGFPDPTNGWLTHDWCGAEMTEVICEQMAGMHGLVRIKFDQSGMAFPIFLKKMSTKVWSTLAVVLRGEEYYTIPHVRMGFKYGAKIHLFTAEYTTETCSPFEAYVKHFAEIKNGADKEKKKYKELYKESQSQEHLNGMRKAEFDRTYSKMGLNALPGRMNLRLDRSQTVITRSPNDCIACLGDGLSFRNCEVETSELGDDLVYKIKYNEGTYEDHIDKFDVVPYLSGYILAYAKMLMFRNFDWLARHGAEMLYTDTDSIMFATTPEVFAEYKKEFIPTQKEFGGMDLEDEFKGFLTLGPKKYIGIQENGDYTFHANGIRASSNVHRDILSEFNKVLDGEIIKTDHFNFVTVDFCPSHANDPKNLRWMTLKGSVEDMCLKWWPDEEAFFKHASSLQAIGFDTTLKRDREEDKDEEDEDDEEEPPTKKCKTGDPHYVYILRELNADGTYVGETVSCSKRLKDHNAGKGAHCTTGRQWEYLHVMQGLKDKNNARKCVERFKRFEGALRHQRPTHYTDWHAIITKILAEPAWADIKLTYSKPSESSSD